MKVCVAALSRELQQSSNAMEPEGGLTMGTGKGDTDGHLLPSLDYT